MFLALRNSISSRTGSVRAAAETDTVQSETPVFVQLLQHHSRPLCVLSHRALCLVNCARFVSSMQKSLSLLAQETRQHRPALRPSTSSPTMTPPCWILNAGRSCRTASTASSTRRVTGIPCSRKKNTKSLNVASTSCVRRNTSRNLAARLTSKEMKRTWDLLRFTAVRRSRHPVVDSGLWPI